MKTHIKILFLMGILCFITSIILVFFWKPTVLNYLVSKKKTTISEQLQIIDKAILYQNIKSKDEFEKIFNNIFTIKQHWITISILDKNKEVVDTYFNNKFHDASSYEERINNSVSVSVARTKPTSDDSYLETKVDLNGEINFINKIYFRIYVFIFLFFISFSLFIFIILRNSVYKRIKELINYSNKLKHNNFNFNIKNYPNDEFKILYKNFYEMQKNIAKFQNEALNAKNEAIRSSDSKSKFLTTMSHELRTPMNGILGIAELMLESKLSEDQYLNYVKIILTSGKTLVTLLNNFLDITKIESGKLELNFNSFNIINLVSEIKDLYQAFAESQHVNIRVSTSYSLPSEFIGDSVRIRQIISNLVSNALKNTMHGDVIIQIEKISSNDFKTGHPLIKFSIIDTGSGIPYNRLDSLFKPFTQIINSNNSNFSGSGLGLSIVKELVIAMNGEVGVESTLGLGSCFWFIIPIQLNPSQSSASEAIHVDQPLENGSSLNEGDLTKFLDRKILIVDDNDVNRLLAEKMLERMGFEVFCASTGLEAIRQFEGNKDLDLIFMDCRMPEMDGYECADQIRKIERKTRAGRIPIIALTANAFDEDRGRAIEAGMDDLLAKPVSRDSLKGVILKWLHSVKI